ncbi:hypothetical protein BP5796_12217 [Coleophoma crateriformis]|uniref:Peptidase C15, pyroglutamyl peptidase I-like protein n=1 Tax=Coleophoma crateriformis TaxID=565419 RepID=A0A3D8Q9F1_9HELO|nr:hypothetical protein BP5796_12217 [Coleophoma crateriformis]
MGSSLSKFFRPPSTIHPRELVEKDPPADPQPPTEVNVVVTGFGVWSKNVPWPPPPFNTSWLIADALPRVIFRQNKRNIRIITYPKPISGTWTGVRELIPQIWDGQKDFFGLPVDPKKGSDDRFQVHAVLHCGCLDQPGEAFRLERNAFKEEYTLPDNDGLLPSEDDKTGGGDWINFPVMLSTDINTDTVLAAVKAKISGEPLVLSDDPNRYTCGWMYWVSLAELYKRQEKLRALFMHTPIEGKSEDIEIGVKIASIVIQSMVEDLEERKLIGLF